jgi:hypothetical protein
MTDHIADPSSGDSPAGGSGGETPDTNLRKKNTAAIDELPFVTSRYQ